MITSLLLGNKKNLIIGGAVAIGLIALVSASSGTKPKEALSGVGKKKPTPKKKSTPKQTGGRKSATLKV